MKTIIILLAFITLAGCKESVQKKSENSIEEIYKRESLETMKNFETRYVLNRKKVRPFYLRAEKIHAFFKEIEQNDTSNNSISNINEIIDEIIETYGAKKYQSNATLKMRFSILKQSNKTNLMDNEEYNILLLETHSKVLSSLYAEIDDGTYKFNKLKAYVVSQNTVLEKGETFKGKVIISAIDTTINPRIKIGNDTIPVENGIGMIKIKALTKGIKTYSGELDWVKDDWGELEKLPFEFKYTVK